MKKLLTALLALVSSVAFGATLSPISLLNPAGSTAGQAIVSTGASTAPEWGGIGVSGIEAIAANTVLANATASSASPTAFAMPSCATALQWTAGSGFACNSVGAFASLSASGTVSGAGFTNISVGYIDLLRQISAVPYTNAVSVLGYHSAGDGYQGTYAYQPSDTTDGAYFTATAASGTLTVSAITNGSLALYDVVNGGGLPVNGCFITALGTGTGGTGTYTLSCASSSGSGTMVADSGGDVIVDYSGRRWVNTASGMTLREFGAYGDDSHNDTWQISAAFAEAAAKKEKLTDAGGKYLTSSTINITSNVVFEGADPQITESYGSLELPLNGTWFYLDHANNGFNISSPNGITITNFGTYRPTQVAPTYGSQTGYAPVSTGIDLVVSGDNSSRLKNIFCLNPTYGIQFNGTGGLYLDGYRAESLGIGLSIDQNYDTSYISNIHVWPFWSGPAANNAWNYALAHSVAIKVERSDNPFLSNIFSIHQFASLELTDSTYGGANKVHVVNSDADTSMYGILVDPQNGNSITGQFENITIQGAANDSNTPAIGTVGVYITHGINYLQFDNTRITNEGTYGFELNDTSTGGIYTFGNLIVDSYNEDSASGTANGVYFSSAQNIYLNSTPAIVTNNSSAISVAFSAPQGSIKSIGGSITALSMTVGTTYTNDGNRPIFVSVSGIDTVSSNAVLDVNGNQASICTATNVYCNVSAYVPPGATYSVNGFGTITSAWSY